MNIVLGVLVGLVVLMLLVVLHEAGHFVAARRNGVRVLEFGIGFPPRAAAWVRENGKWRKLRKDEWNDNGVMKTVMSETNDKNAEKTQALSSDKKLITDGLVFSINWLPIGGFCQMDGESAVDTRKGTFGKASFWSKTKILFAGVAMNWLTGIVILTILAWTGMPTFLDNQFTIENDTRIVAAPVEVVEVVDDSPAKKAGFTEGDKIIAVNGKEALTSSEINAINRDNAGKEVRYTVNRNAEACHNAESEAADCEVELTATLNGDDAEYLLGVAMQSSQTLSYSTWSAPLVGIGLTAQITAETYKGLGEMIWNLFSGLGQMFSFDQAVRESGQEAISAVGDSVSGPVGIIGMIFPSFTAAGPTNLAFLAALISISLACMNVLPIPALDGGRWLLIAIYKLRKKKLTKEVEQKIVARSMYVLLIIMAAVTILDITRFF